MARTETVPVPGGVVTAVFTDRSDGDFAIAGPPHELGPRRRAVIDRPWTWLKQVHGDGLVSVTEAGQHAGTEADGAVTAEADCPLAIMTADCAPVVLVADRAVAVVHAGWRGIVSGIIGRAADELSASGGRPVATLVGPCINPEAYEFGADDLDAAERLFGPSVRATTSWGTPALDVPEAVAVACRAAGWPPPEGRPPCTSDEAWFSHRTRTDGGRQATVAWISRPAPAGEEIP